MKRFSFLFAALLSAGLAVAEPAHVHGQAALSVAVDGDLLSIGLESPLDNLLGFERAPRSEAERQRVRVAVAQLRDGAAMFGLDPAAQCSLQSVEVDSEALAPELLGKPAAAKEAHAHGKDGQHQHADMDVEYVFSCRQMSALNGIEVGLFKAFPKMKRLSVQVAGKGGQSAQRLTPQAARIVFKP